MNFRAKLYYFFWLIFALVTNCGGTPSLYAQNTEFKKLFEEAAEQQYNNPEKSLDLYKYLLKTDLDKNSQFSVHLEQFHTYQTLEDYNLAVETKQVLDNLTSKIYDKELQFKYWLATTFLYHSLDFRKETQNSLDNLEASFKSLSKEQKVKNQKYLDCILVLLDTINRETDKIEKLKAIEAKWNQDEGKSTWLSFEFAELYFDKDKDSSLFYFDKVLVSQNHLLNPIAQIYKEWIENKSIDSTVVSLQIIENQSLQTKLKIAFLNRLISFWEFNAQSEKIVHYTEELEKIKKVSSLTKRQAKTLLLENTYYANRDSVILESEKEKKQQLLILFVIASCLLAYLAFWLYRKKKLVAEEKKAIDKETAKSNLIPNKTERDILKRLDVFEHSTLFLDKQLRIATLAKHLQTNTRYLSLILNDKKNKTFNNYINQLRINYIVNKLDNDAIYLSYKISYLAEESGFASQSSFSSSFKEVTGMSPSAYIKKIVNKGTT